MCLFWTQRKIFWRKFVIRLFWDTIDLKILLCFPHSSKYLPLCSEQTHSYRFGSIWRWVNDDRIFIFGWTIPLTGAVQWSATRSLYWPTNRSTTSCFKALCLLEGLTLLSISRFSRLFFPLVISKKLKCVQLSVCVQTVIASGLEKEINQSPWYRSICAMAALQRWWIGTRCTCLEETGSQTLGD